MPKSPRVAGPALALALWSALSPAVAPAWGPEGHRIVARIAAIHLNDKGRALVFNQLSQDLTTKSILKNKLPTNLSAMSTAMAAAATWPDDIKGTSKGTGTSQWHFLDLAFDDGATQISARCPDGVCLLDVMNRIAANIPAGTKLHAATGSNEYVTSEQLKFLIHFFGDLHQPLHCATDADAGGNCIKTKGFGSSKLHNAWDTFMVRLMLADTGQSGTNAEKKVASNQDAAHTVHFDDLTALKAVDKMVLESQALAFQSAYGPVLASPQFFEHQARSFFKVTDPTHCTDAPPEFRTMTKIDLTTIYSPVSGTKLIIADQLAKAGYRLADALNRIGAQMP